jgi:hypothetical protein
MNLLTLGRSIALVLFLAASALAHNGEVFEVPMATEPPILDGIMGDDEWKGALMLPCSISQITRDALRHGWTDAANQTTPISYNQLNTTAPGGEDAGIGRTDEDASANVYHMWDGDALYAFDAARDNAHDTQQAAGADPAFWWERDSISLYIDLTHAGDEPGQPYTSMNIINFMAEPQNSSPKTITWERTEAGSRASTQDPSIIRGLKYGYRFYGDDTADPTLESSGANYAIEGAYPWEVLMQFNLPAPPTVGSMLGWSWIILDPDGEEGFGGQIQSWGSADVPSTYTDFVFSDRLAGPGAPTAVERDSWGRIKATFTE